VSKCFDYFPTTQSRPAIPLISFPPSLQPDKRPRSPMTADPLRAKDLLPLPLMADPDWKVSNNNKGGVAVVGRRSVGCGLNASRRGGSNQKSSSF